MNADKPKPECVCPGRVPHGKHTVEGCPAWRDRRGQPTQPKTAKRGKYLAEHNKERDAKKRVVKHPGIRAELDQHAGLPAEKLDQIHEAMLRARLAP